MKMSKLGAAIALSFSTVCLANFDDANTDYSNSKQEIYVWNEALEPIELVNSILCFTQQFNSTDFVNQGPYIALVDEARCFKEKSSNNGTTIITNEYTKAVSEVTRVDNVSPLQTHVWLPDMGEEGFEQAIRVKSTVTRGASQANPFGQFTFHFDFVDNFTNNTPQGGGEILTINDIDGKIGFTLIEAAQFGNESHEQSASVVLSSDKSQGIALTGSAYDSPHGSGGQKYALAFNQSHVLVQTTEGDFADLPYKSGDSSTNSQCLSRTDFTQQAYRYHLFNANDGSKVSLNSGFSFLYDSDNDGQNDSYGFLGYWGLWTDNDAALTTGTLLSANDGDNQSQYELVTAPGRLIKHSAETLALSELAGIDFYYWSEELQNDAQYDQYIVRYQDGAFNKVAKIGWNEQGESVVEITPAPINTDNGYTLYMYSEQLGGDVKYSPGSTSVTFYQQTIVNGQNDTNLSNGSFTLTCFDNCPKGLINDSLLSSYNAPFEDLANSVNSGYEYSFNVSGNHALTLVRVTNSEAVKFSDDINRDLLANSPHSWGLRSGAMVLNTTGLTDVWDIYNPELIDEFYVWETGVENWNQLYSAKDSSGQFVSFDKPIQVRYQHSDANDRSGDATSYNGQVFLLNYGGNGDLWGIPYQQSNDRGYPAFSLKDGTLLGNSNQYVVKASEVEEKMVQLTLADCASLTLEDPLVPVPTSRSGSANIGAMPVVTDGAKVIGGVNQ